MPETIHTSMGRLRKKDIVKLALRSFRGHTAASAFNEATQLELRLRIDSSNPGSCYTTGRL